MLYVEREWTLICYAGSASEASTDSKPLGSELADIRASLAPECQGFVDPGLGRSLPVVWKASRAMTTQGIDSKYHFSGHRVHLANPSRSGACQ